MQPIKAIFVGRMCPIHVGHENTLKRMFDFAGDPGNALVLIGSVNAPLSFRVCFSYEERRRFLLSVFPEARVAGIPDFHNDAIWLQYLDDLVSNIGGTDPKEVVYFGGCEEDIRFFADDGRKVEIINRFDGSSPRISATEVRDALIVGRPLDGLLNRKIQEDVEKTFALRWAELRKM